jgi:amino acid permease
VVSYAINSQAICSSIDRLFFHRVIPNNAQRRWMILTFGMSVSSYLVANAIPFFKDLVSLIGALTSIPLTLMMPAIFFRRTLVNEVLRPDWTWSYALLIFSTTFTLTGLVGAVRLTQLDWLSHGPPFSCY